MTKRACLQYKMLTGPAASRGTSDTAPVRSSTLSMINAAMIEVNATLIFYYFFFPSTRFMSKSKTQIYNTLLHNKNRHYNVFLFYRKTIPHETLIIRVQMVVRRSESNSSDGYIKTRPSTQLPLQACVVSIEKIIIIIHRQEIKFSFFKKIMTLPQKPRIIPMMANHKANKTNSKEWKI